MPSKVDIWMPLSVGDYLKDTSHLSTIEHGAYLLLLMHYWCKGPLPKDLCKIGNICKLPSDAWSIAQGLLDEFFVVADDGLYHQNRSDKEIEKWQGKRQKAQEKARTAADARWNKDAPSIPTSNAQAMHTPCPSPAPSPLPPPLALTEPKPKTKTKKTSLKPNDEKPVDQRRLDFIEDLHIHWTGFAGTEFVFDGADGKQVDLFLKAWPKLTRKEWRNCLRHRKASSGVIPTERIYRWISRLGDYLTSPLNEYNRTTNGNGEKNAPVSNGTGNQIMGVLKNSLGRTECEGSSGEDGDLPPSIEVGRSDTSTVHAGSSQPRLESVSSGDENSLFF
jgi:uncharacterized protein YdaU (DUF1376 family)